MSYSLISSELISASQFGQCGMSSYPSQSRGSSICLPIASYSSNRCLFNYNHLIELVRDGVCIPQELPILSVDHIFGDNSLTLGVSPLAFFQRRHEQDGNLAIIADAILHLGQERLAAPLRSACGIKDHIRPTVQTYGYHSIRPKEHLFRITLVCFVSEHLIANTVSRHNRKFQILTERRLAAAGNSDQDIQGRNMGFDSCSPAFLRCR